jgi:hypothetical protein
VFELSKNKNNILILFVILFALFIGIYNLGDARITSDGLKTLIGIESKSPLTLLTNYHPNHHIFYSFLLTIIHYLTDKFYLLRWVSVVFGVLAVAMTYRVGKSIGWNNLALVASFLLVIIPLFVRYLRQMRGYSVTLFFGLVILFSLWQGVQTNKKRYWISFVVAAALGFYTHFYVAFAVVAATFIVGGEWLLARKNRKNATVLLKSYIFTLLALGIVLVLLLIPIVSRLLNIQSIEEFSPPEFGPFALTWQFFQGFVNTFRDFSPLGDYKEIPDIFFAFVILGCLNGLREQSRRRATTWLILWWLIPFCTNLIILAIAPWSTAQTRYYLYTTPAYLLLGSYGIFTLVNLLLSLIKTIIPAWSKTMAIHRFALYLGTAILILVIALPRSMQLIEQFSSLKTDQAWTSVTAYLRTTVSEEDIILCEASELPGGDNGKCRWHLNELEKLINPRFRIQHLASMSDFRSIERAREILQSQGRVWLVLYFRNPPPYQADTTPGKPGLTIKQFGNTRIIGFDSSDSLLRNLIDSSEWLLTQSPDPSHQFRYHLDLSQLYALRGDIDIANSHLKQALDAQQKLNDPNLIPELREVTAIVRFYAPANPSPQYPTDINFDNRIKLYGYSLEPDILSQPSAVRVSFYWQVFTPLEKDYAVFVHLEDAEGNVVGYFDFQPFDTIYPTSQWPVGIEIREARLFSLPDELPPGEYTLIIGLYLPDNMSRLRIVNDTTGQGAVRLSTLIVKGS